MSKSGKAAKTKRIRLFHKTVDGSQSLWTISTNPKERQPNRKMVMSPKGWKNAKFNTEELMQVLQSAPNPPNEQVLWGDIAEVRAYMDNFIKKKKESDNFFDSKVALTPEVKHEPKAEVPQPEPASAKPPEGTPAASLAPNPAPAQAAPVAPEDTTAPTPDAPVENPAKDTLYAERAHGHLEAWTYSDGDKVSVMKTLDKAKIEAWAKKHGYKLVWVNPPTEQNPKFHVRDEVIYTTPDGKRVYGTVEAIHFGEEISVREDKTKKIWKAEVSRVKQRNNPPTENPPPTKHEKFMGTETENMYRYVTFNTWQMAALDEQTRWFIVNVVFGEHRPYSAGMVPETGQMYATLGPVNGYAADLIDKHLSKHNIQHAVTAKAVDASYFAPPKQMKMESAKKEIEAMCEGSEYMFQEQAESEYDTCRALARKVAKAEREKDQSDDDFEEQVNFIADELLDHMRECTDAEFSKSKKAQGYSEDEISAMFEGLMDVEAPPGSYKAEEGEAENPPSGPIFSVTDVDILLGKLKTELKAPLVGAYASTLGGAERVSVLVTIAMDPKDQWYNGILENSYYGKYHISRDGTMEHISGPMRLRKTHAKSVQDVVDKFNKLIAGPRQNPPVAENPKMKAVYLPEGTTADTCKYYIWHRQGEVCVTKSATGYTDCPKLQASGSVVWGPMSSNLFPKWVRDAAEAYLRGEKKNPPSKENPPPDDALMVRMGSHRARDYFFRTFGKRQEYTSFRRNAGYGVYIVTPSELEKMKEHKRIVFNVVPAVDKDGNRWMLTMSATPNPPTKENPLGEYHEGLPDDTVLADVVGIFAKNKPMDALTVMKEKYGAEFWWGDHSWWTEIWHHAAAGQQGGGDLSYYFCHLFQNPVQPRILAFCWGRVGNAATYKIVLPAKNPPETKNPPAEVEYHKVALDLMARFEIKDGQQAMLYLMDDRSTGDTGVAEAAREIAPTFGLTPSMYSDQPPISQEKLAEFIAAALKRGDELNTEYESNPPEAGKRPPRPTPAPAAENPKPVAYDKMLRNRQRAISILRKTKSRMEAYLDKHEEYRDFVMSREAKQYLDDAEAGLQQGDTEKALKNAEFFAEQVHDDMMYYDESKQNPPSEAGKRPPRPTPAPAAENPRKKKQDLGGSVVPVESIPAPAPRFHGKSLVRCVECQRKPTIVDTGGVPTAVCKVHGGMDHVFLVDKDNTDVYAARQADDPGGVEIFAPFFTSAVNLRATLQNTVMDGGEQYTPEEIDSIVAIYKASEATGNWDDWDKGTLRSVIHSIYVRLAAKENPPIEVPVIDGSTSEADRERVDLEENGEDAKLNPVPVDPSLCGQCFKPVDASQKYLQGETSGTRYHMDCDPRKAKENPQDAKKCGVCGDVVQ